jgi:hypothetical protein
MIYVAASPDAPLQQGDVFRTIPKVRVTLTNIPYAEGEEIKVANWPQIVADHQDVQGFFKVEQTFAIVLTPDCDSLRAEVIALAEIRKFADVEGNAKDATAPKSLARIITQHARINQKWFYLPPDALTGFGERMAVDFRSVISIPRADLEAARAMRVARLVSPAIEHFRERLGEFYRRYPYDEWYPLNPDEFAAYRADKKDNPDIKPFPWQEKKGEKG